MESREPLLEELKRRRILPIVGTYIAATWLVIELGDWVTERFGLPGDLTSYVFVFMVAMLPGLVLFAWNHGAPGRDQWTRTEFVFLPLNVLLAFSLIYLLNPSLDAEAATETVTIADETGTLQEFTVAREGYHREILTFFWSNDTGDPDLDWLSYGIPIMLAYDLNRVSPAITALTPINSASIPNRLREQGLERLKGVPSGLAVDIARDRRSAAIVMGSISAGDEGVTLSASVVDPGSGKVIGTETITSDDWFAAVDRVTVAVLDLIDVAAADNQSDDPVRQHFSDSLEAVRHFTGGELAIELDNNYPRGISEYETALEMDPAFAEARRALSVAQYLSGDLESARNSANQALRNGYRLSDASKFILRTNRYVFEGDYARAERVLEMWSQVQPNSTRALGALVQFLRLRGGEEALDRAAEAYDRMLELDPNDHSIYRRQAEVEQQRGNYEKAAALIKRYLDEVPGSSDAYLQLSRLHQAAGDLDAAQAAMEDAVILSENPVQSQLGVARLEARRGRYAAAEERLDALLEQPLTPSRRIEVLGAKIELAIALGRVDRALELIDEASRAAEAAMPPAVRIVSIDAQKADLLALKSRFDEAIGYTDAMAERLQPPLVWFLNFNYTSIHHAAENREKFREWHGKTEEIEGQLPEVFRPFIVLERAQIRLWDGDREAAIELIDSALSTFGQSYLQVAEDNLSLSALYVGFAKLYLEAGATGKARDVLEELLTVFPAYAQARMIFGKALLAEGEEAAGKRYVREALDIWSDADEGFVYVAEARLLLGRDS